MKKGIVAVLAGSIGIIIGIGTAVVTVGKNFNKDNGKVDKFKSYYYMLNHWLQLKQKGKCMESYFVEKGYKEIAIYGMGELGKRLYSELENTDIKIKYAVDKMANCEITGLEIFDLDETLDEVDAIIVTATFDFEAIYEKLQEKVSFPIVSLEDIIYEI